MNRKAFEMTISTLILMVLGVVLLVALILALTGSFETYRDSTNPLLETTELTAIKRACELSCFENLAQNFCCVEQQIQDETINCSDERLNVDCHINCATVTC